MEKFSYIIVEKEKLCITDYAGTASVLEIPSVIDGHQVCVIGKKAFWGKRCLQRIVLPKTLERIEDWAFAGCNMLQEIVFPSKSFTIGNKIFWKCNRLRYLYVGEIEQSLARLMACGVNELGAEYLLDPLQAGNKDWYQSFDARLLQILHEPEETVLKDLVYCAEEDMLEKQEECLYRQRLHKAEIAMLRILYSQELQYPEYEQLRNYLLQRSKGSQTEEVWDIVKAKTPEQFLYCSKLFEIGGIHSGNIDRILSDLDETQIELKAYILKKWKEETNPGNIWEMLSLDSDESGEII